MSPAFRSASIAICRPGIASRVNRAVTSEMRTAPWLMTRNWIAMSTRKTTTPTTKLPPTTNWPNAMMTWPAASTPSCAVHQHEARGRDVQRQPQQRQQQQQRRKHRELDRLLDVDRRQQQHHREPDVDRQQQVEQRTAAAARSSAARPPGRRPAPADACLAAWFDRVGSRPSTWLTQNTSCFKRTRYASTSATAPKSAAGIASPTSARLEERLRERHVLDDRHAVLARLFRIARGHQVLALGQRPPAPPSRRGGTQRDGEVGRVGDDDGRALDVAAASGGATSRAGCGGRAP